MTAERIDIQPWMRAPETLAVMAALETAGGDSSARFVGGCVRNAVLGESVSDIDIATVLTPAQVTAALEHAGLKAVPTGVEYGTVTAVASGKPFEITTLRRDVETDGRRAVVAFTDNWAEDAARRDFRLNALYADAEGRVFDPTGEGLADARAGRIIFVGDAETRIREDALRILRFFRFFAWYGRGEPDATGLAACAASKSLIAGLSGERVSKEFLRLLAAENPRPSVRTMASVGVLDMILPAAQTLDRFDHLVGIDTQHLFKSDPVLRLAALLPDDPVAGHTPAARLRLSNAERGRLVAALDHDVPIVAPMSAREVRRAVYRLGRQPFLDQARLAWADSAGPARAEAWLDLIGIAWSWSRPNLPLSGAEIMAAGVPEGPLVGAVMRAVETWWIEQDFIDDKPSVMKRMKAVAQEMAG